MPDENDDFFKLLLSEKEHSDRQISAGFAANLTVLGTLFTAVVAGTGWLFSTETGAHLDSAKRGIVLLALVALGSIGSLMGTVFNGFAFGYIAYKSHLGDLFARHLHLEANPLNAASFVNKTSARRPIVFGTVLLSLSQAIFTSGLYVIGVTLLRNAMSADQHTAMLFWFVVPVAGLMLLAAFAGSILVVWTMNKMRNGDAGEPTSPRGSQARRSADTSQGKA
jgi:hypothetical protein